MKQIYKTLLLLLFCIPAQAQDSWNERVYVHTDKDCYVAGEDVWVKFVTTDTQLRTSTFSKVGYVEICDLEKPWVQHKLQLENGCGVGKLTLPVTLPSGIYQLNAYTRYMRNEGNEVAFKRQLAIVNLARPSESDRMRLMDADSIQTAPAPLASNIQVSTDRSQYAQRSRVSLSLKGIPADAASVVVSVTRNDRKPAVPQVDTRTWLRQIGNASPVTQWKWQPEYEGHIVLGKNPANAPIEDATYSAGIGFVGNDIHYIHGQSTPEGLTLFYTDGLYGPQEVVTSVVSHDGNTYNMDIVSPFAEALPKELPTLQIQAEDSCLMDRFVGVQLKQIMGIDSLHRHIPLQEYYLFRDPIVYDLDQYTRFSTLRETIIEFIGYLVVRRHNGKPHIRVLMPAENRFNTTSCLLLLDGIPIRNHEDILNYNPRNIRYIKIYDGKYYFGGELYECMVSFVSHRENLSSIQLNADAQLVAYDFPGLPATFTAPEYPDSQTRLSLQPDYRHTLYWYPHAEQLPATNSLQFYTSDLSGEYKITVEGFTRSGTPIYGTSTFRVTP